MVELLIILVITVVLVYVIWRFTRPKSASYGIEVVAGKSKKKNYDEISDQGESLEEDSINKEQPVDSRMMEESEGDGQAVIGKLKSSTEKECIELIYQNPKDINAYLRLCVYYLQRQKWNDAKEVLMEALKVDPDNDKLYNNLGIVWYRLKRYNNAVTAFEKAIKYNDKIAHRFMNLGLSLAALGENEKASECFSKAISLDPEAKVYQDLLSEAKSLLV
ncbi:MAG: tetratricopeptide repeat protein [Patescibacteria group bacterium]